MAEAQGKRWLWEERISRSPTCNRQYYGGGQKQQQLRMVTCVLAIFLLWARDGEAGSTRGGILTGGKIIYGFEEKGRISAEDTGVFKTTAIHYRHLQTGADFVSVITTNAEKTFIIGFRTPPSGNEGTPHVMEHAVLGGSRKYPIHDPFSELTFGSTASLNAFTARETTGYIAQSRNTEEFWNLFDLYWDAVYYPKCIEDETILKSEGWSYRLKDANDTLKVQGIVHSEMLPIFEDPMFLYFIESYKHLYPDTCYRFDSGGNPVDIPKLNFTAFKKFHEDLYHPTNSLMYFSGNDDPMERLKKLDGYLTAFQRNEAAKRKSSIKLQKPWSRPLHVRSTYPAWNDQMAPSFVGIHWLIADHPNSIDIETAFALQIVSKLMCNYVVVGLQATLKVPDADPSCEIVLGQSVQPYAYIVFEDPMFNVSRKDLEWAVLFGLHVMSSGIMPKWVHGIINQIEIERRAIQEKAFKDYFLVEASWKADVDPLRLLNFITPLESIRSKVAALGGANAASYFAPIIRKYLINNPSRMFLEMEPDIGGLERQAQKEKENLQLIKQKMTAQEIQRIVEDTLAIEKEMQPSPPEEINRVLKTIPSSALVPPAPAMQSKVTTLGAATLFEAKIFTNDLVYIDFLFSLDRLPRELVPYIAVLRLAWDFLDTNMVFSTRVLENTGGLAVYLEYAKSANNSNRTSQDAYLGFFGSARNRQVTELIDLMQMLVTKVKIDDRFIFEIVAEGLTRDLEDPSAMDFVYLRMAGKDNMRGWFAEQTGGKSLADFARKLLVSIRSNWTAEHAKFIRARDLVISQDRLFISVTGDNAAIFKVARFRLQDFLEAIPVTSKASSTSWRGLLPGNNEALPIRSRVSYVGESGNLKRGVDRLSGSALTATTILDRELWWDIRAQGKAYGALSFLESDTGFLGLLSYRDPNMLSTLDEYDESITRLLAMKHDNQTLQRRIVKAWARANPHLRPSMEAYMRFLEFLSDLSKGDIRKINKEILSTRVNDVKAYGNALSKTFLTGESKVVIASSRKSIEEASRERPLLNLAVAGR